MSVYQAFEEWRILKWSKNNLQTQDPWMDAIDFELNVLDTVSEFLILP